MHKVEDYFTSKIGDLDMSLVKEECKKGSISSRKCSKLWPKFPCYEDKIKKCFNADGDVFLEDPIDGVLYALGETYVQVTNSIQKLLNTLPDEKRLEKEEKLIRIFRDYGLSMFSLPDTHLSTTFKTIKDIDYQDIPKYVDTASEYVDTAKQYVISKFNREGGGGIYDKITNPMSGEELSIHSKKGIEVLEHYTNALK